MVMRNGKMLLLKQKNEKIKTKSFFDFVAGTICWNNMKSFMFQKLVSLPPLCHLILCNINYIIYNILHVTPFIIRDVNFNFEVDKSLQIELVTIRMVTIRKVDTSPKNLLK